MYRVPADFYASNGSQRVKYSRPVSILIEIGVPERTKCVQKCLFFSLVKKCFPPFVKDNEQGPSGRGGGGGGEEEGAREKLIKFVLIEGMI